jgi:hypothetical protein
VAYKTNRALERERREGHEATIRLLKEIEDWKFRATVLARLAADGPCFDSPVMVMAAKHIRDWILKEQCGLNPDGTKYEPSTPE